MIGVRQKPYVVAALHDAARGSLQATDLCAVLRPSWGVIRVWRSGASVNAEEFTIAEAQRLCTQIDIVLADRQRSGGDPCGLWIDHGGQKVPLVASVLWFTAFLVVVRRQLRKVDRDSVPIARQALA